MFFLFFVFLMRRFLFFGSGLEAVSAWDFMFVVFVVVIWLLGCLTWVGVCFGYLSGVMMMFGG
jgi:hypothetical protein